MKDLLKLIKKKSLVYDELEMLSLLLEVDISLIDALNIIRNSSNDIVINNIIYKLNEGLNYSDVFKEYINNEIKEYLSSFVTYLSFKEALKLSLSISKKERLLKNKIIKSLSYPLCLMIFSIVGIYLFNIYCFKGLIDSFKGFNTDLSSLLNFKSFLDIFITLIFIFVLILLILILIFTKKDKMVLAYSFLQKYLPNSRLSEYLSSRFVIYFNECHKVGLKTKDSISILKSFKKEPLISFIAFHVDEAFLSGNDMIEAMSNKYLDNRLKAFIKIAVNTSNLNMMLEGYLYQFENRFIRYCARLSKMIELSSYVLIGIMIIFIYQLLFIPMGLIGGL